MTATTIPTPLPATVPGDTLESYIARVNAVPMLSAEKEHALAWRFREENDLEAARTLVMSHLRFVVRVASGFKGYGLPQGDLIQEGNVGLMKAVKRFDPAQGVRLVSFAVHWIKAEIHEYILRNWRIVKVATTKAQRKLFFNLRKNRKRLGWMNNEEVDAVASDLGVSRRDVLEMEQRLNGRDHSFEPLYSDEDAGTAPAAYLQSDTEEPEAAAIASQSRELALGGLEEGLEKLDERSRAIIEARWISEPKSTLHQLADRFEVSAERIRQIEQAALARLRESVAATGA